MTTIPPADDDPNIEEEHLNKIVFSDEVQAAIEQVLQSTDPLDRPDFDSTEYINQIFPNEQSLSNIDEVIGKMKYEISVIDDNIRDVVRGQNNTNQDGCMALEEAQKVIIQLFHQITEIKTRAEKTEDMVKGITRDIKQLDCAKKNLTSAITTLNHLHMLVSGVDNLVKLTERRFYGEIINPLQAITEVNQHFQQYVEIPHIKTLSNRVSQIQSELSTQITKDFQNFFSPTPSTNEQKMSLSQLRDACLVLSVLDDKVKRDLLKWLINLQLQEYLQLFHENQDIAWLDKIDKRYAWLKRHLLDFEDKFGTVFPVDWNVSERISVHFCNVTKTELIKIMSNRRNEIDVKLLLFAINKTQSFEVLLSKRFTGITLQTAVPVPNPLQEKSVKTEARKSFDETSSVQSEDPEAEIIVTPFKDLIGESFKNYLDIYIDSIDKNLAELIERFIEMERETSKKSNNVATKSPVFMSCADLFVFYKKCMVQCNQLSNEKPMFDLTMLFKKYLRDYASKILETKIPKLTSTQTSLGTSMSLLTRDLRDLQNLSTAAGQVIHNFLREGESPRFNEDEIVRLCCTLTTAEYCLETVQQLEDKLKEKIAKNFVENIDLAEEKDIYHGIISSCIQLLVQDMESGCDPALIVMSKIQWHQISNVGDQSPFVNSIISHFKSTVPIIRENLATSRKYYTQFCHKFVNSFIPKYINNLYKCRLTNAQDGGGNILGCEQLLLDTHSLKTVLLDLPSIGSQINRKAPPTYTKVVIKGMSKAEMIVKIVMTPVIPANTFCDQYMKLLPESTLGEFQKILDMKNLKRIDQTNLVDIYRRLSNNSSHGNADQTDRGGGGDSHLQDADRGRIKKLEKLIKKRLPN